MGVAVVFQTGDEENLNKLAAVGWREGHGCEGCLGGEIHATWGHLGERGEEGGTDAWVWARVPGCVVAPWAEGVVGKGNVGRGWAAGDCFVASGQVPGPESRAGSGASSEEVLGPLRHHALNGASSCHHFHRTSSGFWSMQTGGRCSRCRASCRSGRRSRNPS